MEGAAAEEANVQDWGGLVGQKSHDKKALTATQVALLEATAADNKRASGSAWNGAQVPPTAALVRPWAFDQCW